MRRKKAGCGTYAVGCLNLSLFCGFLVMMAVFMFSNGTPEKQKPKFPIGTFERLRSDLSHKGNLATDGNRLLLTFNTSGFMATSSVQHTITNSLKIINESGYDYSAVRFSAESTLVDKFGNESKGVVADVLFERDTVERINWKNFVAWDVFEVADYARLHPSLK